MSRNTIIISNLTINVNPSSEKTKTERETPDYIRKWTTHKKESQHVAEKMMAIGLTGRAIRMAQCADVIEYNYCHDCDTYTVARANLCRDRFCPVCAWRLSLQRYIAMTQIVERLSQSNSGYSLITLTVQNCRIRDLSTVMKTMASAWNRLCQRKTIKTARGWARSVEVTYNSKHATFHPHYHILIAWGDHNGKNDIIREWCRSCEQSNLVAAYQAQDAQDIINKETAGESMAGAICETFKYAVKGSDLDDIPLGAFRILAGELAGKRLVAFGGEIKDIARELKINMECVDSGEVQICRRCGSIDIDRLIYHWAFDYYSKWR